MKRLVVVLAIVIAICAMSVSAVAELGGFVESPSANGAPTLVPEDSDASVNVVAYRDRVDTLTEGELTSFENAYKSIVASTDVASMNSKLPRIASRLKVYADKLAISDIFFITVDGDLEDGIASITSETLDKFVSLLYFNGSNWVVVDTDIKDGNIIEKKRIALPEKLENVIKCKNPRCITTTEQELAQVFKLTDKENRVYRCIYCETKAK